MLAIAAVDLPARDYTAIITVAVDITSADITGWAARRNAVPKRAALKKAAWTRVRPAVAAPAAVLTRLLAAAAIPAADAVGTLVV
jgi:hypothetical protein